MRFHSHDFQDINKSVYQISCMNFKLVFELRIITLVTPVSYMLSPSKHIASGGIRNLLDVSYIAFDTLVCERFLDPVSDVINNVVFM